jgi:hypothetical protein
MRVDGEETSSASKLVEPAAEESSPDDQEAFDPFAMTGAVNLCCSSLLPFPISFSFGSLIFYLLLC